MNSGKYKKLAWIRRKKRVRKKIKGTNERPRLCVFRSNKNIYAQIIDDTQGKTLATVSSLSSENKNALKSAGNIEAAKKIGELIAKKALAKDIKKVVFDRNGFLYHGRVKALSDSAQEAGLGF